MPDIVSSEPNGSSPAAHFQGAAESGQLEALAPMADPEAALAYSRQLSALGLEDGIGVVEVNEVDSSPGLRG